MQNRILHDVTIPFTLMWPIFSACDNGSGSSLDKPLSSCTSRASIVSSRYMRHALSSADKCSILSSLCTHSKRLKFITWKRQTRNSFSTLRQFVPKHGHDIQDRNNRSELFGVQTAAKEWLIIPLLSCSWLSFILYWPVRRIYFKWLQVPVNSFRSRVSETHWRPLSEQSCVCFTSNRFTSSHQLSFALLILTVNVHAGHYHLMHKHQFISSSFQQKTEALSSVVFRSEEDRGNWCTSKVCRYVGLHREQISNRVSGTDMRRSTAALT